MATGLALQPLQGATFGVGVGDRLCGSKPNTRSRADRHRVDLAHGVAAGAGHRHRVVVDSEASGSTETKNLIFWLGHRTTGIAWLVLQVT